MLLKIERPLIFFKQKIPIGNAEHIGKAYVRYGKSIDTCPEEMAKYPTKGIGPEIWERVHSPVDVSYLCKI